MAKQIIFGEEARRSLERGINALAMSGMGSRPSGCTSGGGRSHIENQEETSWVVPHAERYQPSHLILGVREHKLHISPFRLV